MRTLVVVTLAVLLAGSGLAQRPQFGSGTGFGNVIYPGTGRPPINPNVTGFGNVVFPGTGGLPNTVPNFSITNPNFANGLANTVSGRVPYGAGQGKGSRGRTSFVYVPYAYPVYTGGYDEYAQPQQPNVTVVNQAPQPPVVINQTFLTPQAGVAEAGPAPGVGPAGMTIYQAPARSAEEMAAAGAEATQQYFLIAFKDHSIYSAIAYWTDGDTLHYFTSGNTHNQVSMSLVDKELTERLNKERNVDVRIAK
jgi:hypothetical protein